MDALAEHPFWVVAAVLALAAVLGALAVRLRQPLLVGFLAVGVLAGPAGLGWVEASGEVALLAELGIAVLLFLVGLKLDVHLIRSTGAVALVTGLTQVLVTAAVGLAVALAIGLALVPALYVALALAFSSTIIVVKLLSDTREIDRLHGRVAVGILIVQDVVVVLVMIALTATGGLGAGDDLALTVLATLAKGAGLLLVVGAAMRWMLPRVLGQVARSPELLVLVALAWGVSLAAVGDALGFSAEVGAFLGGVSLASTPFREAVGSRLVSLRDFLLLFFFVDLGARLRLDDAVGQLGAAAVLSVVVLVGKVVVVVAVMGALGYRRRTSFLTGVTLAQISEFSLVLVALGLGLGHIGTGTVTLVTLVALVTISVSSYVIPLARPLHARLDPFLRRLERPGVDADARHREEHASVEVVVLGAGRYGGRLVEQLRARRTDVLVVDVDPHALARAEGLGAEVLFADAGEPELSRSLPLGAARWVVSTIPSRDVGVAVLHGLHHAGFTGGVAVTAHLEQDVPRLREAGADVVLRPFATAAERNADLFASGPPASPDDPAAR
ncbi:cation:proton antiporter [Aquipuribacter sp. SD81]|uniref:cation:proton antiporter n=1 Tax=Aquipuribacter sp. SD81 TaxID=3127703 RepID=UPI0030171235